MASPGQEALALVGQVDKIGFDTFVINIVENVFDVLTKSALDQLTAYGEYVDTVSESVADYQNEVAGVDKSSSQVKDYIETVLGACRSTRAGVESLDWLQPRFESDRCGVTIR